MFRDLIAILFGSGRNVVAETAEVFVENKERNAQRHAASQAAALQQFGQEFRDDRAPFDRFIDGLNRLPRPFLALGVIAMICSAMFYPAWFGVRMEGLALVPEPLWWLMGAVVSFYFGGRYQAKSQQFKADLTTSAAMAEALAVERAEPEIDTTPAGPVRPNIASPGNDATLGLALLDAVENEALDELKGQQ